MSACLSSFMMAQISYLFSLKYRRLIAWVGRRIGHCAMAQAAQRIPRGAQPILRVSAVAGYLFRSANSLRLSTPLTFRLIRGRILFRQLQGQIYRGVSEDRVNRRRILAGIISVGVLGCCALFIPTWRKTPEVAPASTQAVPRPISEPVDSEKSEAPLIPVPVVEAKAASRPPVPQSLVGIPDVDSHKAFGSKSAPVTMGSSAIFNAQHARRFLPPPIAG